MQIRSLALAGATAFLMAVPFMGSAEAATVRCMTDDGYGRYRPCDSSYKAANPNWRASDNCMTDALPSLIKSKTTTGNQPVALAA
jgi:hypothetical protein